MKPHEMLKALVVVILSFAHSGCTGSNLAQTQIARVLQSDITQKETMPQEADALILHDWVMKYLKFADTLDLSRCPQDFRQVFLEHQLAIRDLNKYLQRLRDRREAGLIASVGLLMTEDLIGDARRFNEQLESTWRDVERSATKHGVKVKQVDVQPFVNP